MLYLRVLVGLMIANGAPVIGQRLFGDRLARPLDGGRRLKDGRPLFGPSKTVRGLVLSLLATSLLAPFLGFTWLTGLLLASFAMLGDLLSSFVKRRMDLSPSSRAFGLDQVPEALLPLLALQARLGLTMFDVVLLVVLFTLLEIPLSIVLFKLRVRRRPY